MNGDFSSSVGRSPERPDDCYAHPLASHAGHRTTRPYGQKPSHVLVTRFLHSSRDHPKSGGLVVISTVDSPFYEGAFKIDDAAKKAGFAEPDIYTFNPKDYPAYSHQNTADRESAIDERTAFATFVFSA